MKKFTFLSFFTALTFAAAMIISGCTKEGPQGPAGEDGQDGQDGTAGCIECHDDSQSIFAASIQWEASTHATGGNFERNDASCAPCHTSQGFLEVMETGAQETAEAISNPAPVNCYTCHNIHDTFTPEDWALTATEPVEFWLNGDVADQGAGNLCSQCHQSRVPSPMWDASIPEEEIDITYFRWGPHHGPQGNMIAGSGGFEIEGSASYTNSAHSNIGNTCVTCHMAEPFGAQAGGHTMKMGYQYHGSLVLNEAGCVACHEGDDLATMTEAMQDEIDGYMADLRDVLLTRGVLDSSNYIVAETMLMKEAGAVWNYLYVLEDRSGGAHNKKYARALLLNSIESLEE